MATLLRWVRKFLRLIIFLAVLGAVACWAVMKYYPDSSVGTLIQPYYTPVYEKVVTYWQKFFPPKAEAPAAQPPVAEEAPPATEEPVAEVVAVEPATPTAPQTKWLSGKKLSQSSLKGKVVLVYAWDLDHETSRQTLPRVRDIYESFKHHPFVVIGTHAGGRTADVKAFIKKKRLTFTNYENFQPQSLFPNQPPAVGCFYVFDKTGKLIARGRNDRVATEAVVNAISAP